MAKFNVGDIVRVKKTLRGLDYWCGINIEMETLQGKLVQIGRINEVGSTRENYSIKTLNNKHQWVNNVWTWIDDMFEPVKATNIEIIEGVGNYEI